MKIEVLELAASRWGEGALWHDEELLYVDIEAHLLHRYNPTLAASKREQWDLGERVGFVVATQSAEKYIVGTDSGLYRFDTRTGAKTLIVNPEPDKDNNRFNDGKCSPDGRLFAGTISLKKITGDATLYRLDPDGTLHTAYGPVTNSNGICWNEKENWCYYIDTPRREVLRFDYQSDTGALENASSLVNTDPLVDASPDGMTIDSAGNLWVAFCHGGCVLSFDGKTGQLLERIELPALETTSCCFGGAQLDELYVTTGVHKSVEEEHGGKVFRITGLGVRGTKTPVFAAK